MCGLFFIHNKTMKHTYSLIIICCILLTLNACKSSRSEIRKVAYQYSYALANYDIESAVPYATPETQNTTLQTARMLMNLVDTAYIASDTPAKIKIKNIKIQNDTSAVVTYSKKTPIKHFDADLDLVLRDGHWMVQDVINVSPQQERLKAENPILVKDGKRLKEQIKDTETSQSGK